MLKTRFQEFTDQQSFLLLVVTNHQLWSPQSPWSSDVFRFSAACAGEFSVKPLQDFQARNVKKYRLEKGCTRAQPLKPRVFTNYLHALHVAESLVVCLETARWKRDCKSASRKIAHINALVSLFCTLTLEHS